VYVSTLCRIRSAIWKSLVNIHFTIGFHIAGGRLTCWLINTMPMSFLSVVKRSNAASMAALSVFASTTKKFFCESGGAVTC